MQSGACGVCAHGILEVRTDIPGVLMAAAAPTDTGAHIAPHQPRIRYQQGEGRYIIELMRRGVDNRPMGQVADLEWGLVYAPQPIGSILARGYWTELAEPIDTAEVLAKVAPVVLSSDLHS